MRGWHLERGHQVLLGGDAWSPSKPVASSDSISIIDVRME